ncbi:MAG: DUF2267 domain-containing protein [Actinomycetota bacterium]
MKHDEFIGQVQQRARLDSRGAAEAATRATLETLGERLSGGAAENLAAQLPPEIGEHLRRTADGTGQQIDLEDFFGRITQREGTGVDEPQAVFHARCVLEVVDEATTGNLLGKLKEQLPAEYERLFSAGSTGRMPS